MEIIMPKMGESVNEGTIIKWYKKVGDKVKQDEIIFEISTDKVDTEIPSPATGVLTEILYNEGDTVEAGTAVAIIDGGDEDNAKKEIKIEEKISVEKENNKMQNNLVEIEMPKMGESVMEGTIIKWFKKVGEKIAKDETLFEISTDKVDTEVPSPVEGTVAEILIGEQETVEVGTIVAKIASGDAKIIKTSSSTGKEETAQLDIEEPLQMHDNFSQTKTSKIKMEKSARFYSPLVLNIAQKENISFDELNNITGSGLQGRVTKKDILKYLKDRKSSAAEVQKIKPHGAPVPDFTPISVSGSQVQSGVEKIPMDNIRQRIMEHMVLSRDTAVHVTSMIEVDMSKVHNIIKHRKDELMQKQGIKLTYMAFIAQACVRALKEYPVINSTIDGNYILQKHFVNLGIAVALENGGLIVPNIKNADQLNLLGIANAINDVALKARNKKLLPDDITGGTFSITNYGVFGTVFGTPIINQPEVAILGVGSVEKKPVVVEIDGADSIAVKPVVALTLSHDHRLVDGMLGGLFLKFVKQSLENIDSELL